MHTTVVAGIGTKADGLGLSYTDECVHEFRAKVRESLCQDITPVIIDFYRSRVLFHGQLAQVASVVQKVLHGSHGDVIVIEVDISELGALVQGRHKNIEVRVLHPTIF